MSSLSGHTARYVVFFESTYGATESYAKECARCLGCSCFSLHDADAIAGVLADADSARTVAIVFSPNYAGKIAGVKTAQKLLRGGVVDVALAAVGMTPLDIAREKDLLAAQLGADANQVARFYLPGNLEYSRLSRVHRSIMWGMVKVLEKKPHPNAAEQNMIDGYGKDTIGVDFAELQPILEWGRGIARP